MKKLFLAGFLIVFLLLPFPSFAHSGCCSWHGGVKSDGCGCNDGTPLSSTCAPYYTCTNPQQNTAPANASDNTSTYTAPIYVAPTNTPVPPTSTPTPTPTTIPTPTTKPTDTPIPTTTVLGTSANSNTGNAWAGVIGIGIVAGLGFGIYTISKRLRNTTRK